MDFLFFLFCRCGAHVYNHYLDCRDTNYFVCEDTISDVLALPGEKVKHLTPVLACQDRSLRVLRDSTLMYNVELPGTYVKCTNEIKWNFNFSFQKGLFHKTIQVTLSI